MNGKKIMALALAGVLSIAVLAGCTAKDSNEQKPDNQTTQSETAKPETSGESAQTPDAAEKPAETPTDTPAADAAKPEEKPEEKPAADSAASAESTTDAAAAETPAVK